MLSPDVPEFIPRGYTASASTNSTAIIKPRQDNSKPTLRKSTYQSSLYNTPTSTHNPPTLTKYQSNTNTPQRSTPTHHSYTHTHQRSTHMPSHSTRTNSNPSPHETKRTQMLPRHSDSWRQPKEASNNHREDQTHTVKAHHNATEPIPTNHPGIQRKKSPEKEISQKNKSKPNSATEDLELHIATNLMTPRPNYTYTKILKSKQPGMNVPEIKTSKSRGFSFITESHWPSLGESLPLHKVPDKNCEISKPEKSNNHNPWMSRSDESSPIKSPVKHPWQERGTTEETTDASVRPKINEKDSRVKSPSKSYVTPRQERGTREQNKDASVRLKTTSSPVKHNQSFPPDMQKKRSVAEQIVDNSVRPKGVQNDYKFVEDSVKTKTNLQRKSEIDPPDADNNRLENKSKRHGRREQGGEENHTSTTLNIDSKASKEEADQASKENIVDDDSDLFQWKVIGEKKKKVRIKPQEEIKHFPQPRRDDGGRYKTQPNKPILRDSTKQDQNLPSRTVEKYRLHLSKSKDLHSPTEETQETVKKPLTSKTDQEKKKKTRPTKVMSLANVSSDKRDTKQNSKTSTTTKPMDEETKQRLRAAKQMKKEEKRKQREMKAREALIHNRQKDTKVSFISQNLLEKTQREMLRQTRPSDSIKTAVFNLHEYPSLDLQRSATPKPSLHKEPWINNKAAKNTYEDSNISSEIIPSTDSRINNDSDPVECAASTYKTALLSAKEKNKKMTITTNSVTTTNTVTNTDTVTTTIDFPITDTMPQKKKVRTRDPIELNLFDLAKLSKKNKKKEANRDVGKFSSKKNLTGEEAEEEGYRRKTTPAPKAAAVLAKRGKINEKKQKKKKLSHVKRCKIEKRHREMLALQMLLQKSTLQQQQQDNRIQESSATPNNESFVDENSAKEGKGMDKPLSCSTNSDTHTQTHTCDNQTHLHDNKLEKITIKNSKIEDIENDKENESHTPTQTSINTNTSIQTHDGETQHKLDKTSETEPTHCPVDKESVVEDSKGNMAMEEKNKEIKKNDEERKDGDKFSEASIEQSQLDDAVLKESASHLIKFLKSQMGTSKVPREYCHQVVTPEVDEVARQLITTLMTLQKRHYLRDPTKARIRKRYVCGMKETTKLMAKMSCVIMAPNIQQCEGPGSLDDAVEKLLNQAEKLKVPVVFALSTKAMKKLYFKSSRKVSCFGIISYQGAQDLFHRLMELLPEVQRQYQQLVASGQCSLPKKEEEEEEEKGESKNVNAEVLANTKTLLMAS